eukprot:jgi/Ulvmu1/9963/UM059_0011.1
MSVEEKYEDQVIHKVYMGNLAQDVSSDVVEAVMDKFKSLDRVIMKQGFCFCYFKKREEAVACIEAFDDQECQDLTDQRLRVEFARGRERGRLRAHEESRENAPANKNLFVVNYDPDATSSQDLEAYFSKWGTISKIQMKDKYSFVEFCELEDAKAALFESRSTQFRGRILTVEYVASGGHRAAQSRQPRDAYLTRSDRTRQAPPPRHYSQERPYMHPEYYCRYEPYSRYEPYERYAEYYDYEAYARYDPRDRHPAYAPPAFMSRGPPSYYRSSRYPLSSPRHCSRSPPRSRGERRGSPYSR